MTACVDLLTRKWWRLVGREIDADGEQAWLSGHYATGTVVRDGWITVEANRIRGSVAENQAGAGLIADMSVLDGPGFRADDLDPAVRSFYEQTSDYRLEVWSGWQPIFWVAGAILARFFGRRVEQLALPTRPLDVAQGMDSAVTVINGPDGRQREAAWLRTLRSTGQYVYSGCYSTRWRPGADRASVHVAFPLEEGNIQVFLRPDIGDDGVLWLRSPGRGFGTDGAYVVVKDRGRTFAACLPLREEFHVWVDDEGELRADHQLSLQSATAVRFHYRLDHRRR